MSSIQLTTPRIVASAAAAAALGFVSYALYFDYKRRNDPVFRKRLLKDAKKIEKVSQQQAEQGKTEIQAALRRALVLINSEPVPTDVEAREQYFMEQVSFGEQLAARSPEHYIPSAISFYRALKVYPAPHELIMIYQKTQPQIVFDFVMELINLDIPASSRDPRDSTSEALLEEIEPTPAAPASETGSSPSTNEGSYVHVDSESIVIVSADEKTAAELAETVEAKAEVVEEIKEDSEIVKTVEAKAEVVEEIKEAEEVVKTVEEKAELVEEIKDEVPVVDPPEPAL